MNELGETAGCLRCGDATNTHATKTGCTRRMPCKPCDEQMRQLWYGDAYSDENDIEAGYRKMAEQSSQEESLAAARRAHRDRNRGFPTDTTYTCQCDHQYGTHQGGGKCYEQSCSCQQYENCR